MGGNLLGLFLTQISWIVTVRGHLFERLKNLLHVKTEHLATSIFPFKNEPVDHQI